MSALQLLMVLVQVLVLVQAQNLTEVQVKLNQTETLKCSLAPDQTYWFMEVDGGLQCGISRSLKEDDTDYYTISSSNKFSVFKGDLTIRNISEQDLRIYSCAKIKDNSKTFGFNERFSVQEVYSLTSEGLPLTPNVNCSTQKQNETKPQDQEQTLTWKVLFYISGVLNALLAITLVTVLCLCLKRRGCRPAPVSSESGPAQNLSEFPQYEEIRISPRPRPRRGPDPGDIYSMAQLPNPSARTGV